MSKVLVTDVVEHEGQRLALDPADVESFEFSTPWEEGRPQLNLTVRFKKGSRGPTWVPKEA